MKIVLLCGAGKQSAKWRASFQTGIINPIPDTGPGTVLQLQRVSRFRFGVMKIGTYSQTAVNVPLETQRLHETTSHLRLSFGIFPLRLTHINPPWEGNGYVCRRYNSIRGSNSMLQHFHMPDMLLSAAITTICLFGINRTRTGLLAEEAESRADLREHI